MYIGTCGSGESSCLLVQLFIRLHCLQLVSKYELKYGNENRTQQATVVSVGFPLLVLHAVYSCTYKTFVLNRTIRHSRWHRLDRAARRHWTRPHGFVPLKWYFIYVTNFDKVHVEIPSVVLLIKWQVQVEYNCKTQNKQCQSIKLLRGIYQITLLII